MSNLMGTSHWRVDVNNFLKKDGVTLFRNIIRVKQRLSTDISVITHAINQLAVSMGEYAFLSGGKSAEETLTYQLEDYDNILNIAGEIKVVGAHSTLKSVIIWLLKRHDQDEATIARQAAEIERLEEQLDGGAE